MGRYVIGRIMQMIPTMLAIIVAIFFLVRLAPGDPARTMAGEFASPEQVEAVRIRLGLDRSLWDQFFIYMRNLLQGDLGYSYNYRAPVLELVLERLPRTLALMLISTFLGFVIGVALGTFSASRFPSLTDSAISVSSVLFYSMPVFWLGMILILVFHRWLGWLPSSGMIDVVRQPTGLAYALNAAKHMILPIVAMLAYNIPLLLRISRASIIDTIGDDYITTARAVGLPERSVFFTHALRNALLPSATMLGLMVGWIFTGAILTETVFSWPGLGLLTKQAIDGRDYPTLMGVLVFTSIAVVIVSLVTDIVYAMLDPRVKLEK